MVAFEPKQRHSAGGTDLDKVAGGLLLPVSRSKYDISGRVFKGMPAPKNLTVPAYAFSGMRAFR